MTKTHQADLIVEGNLVWSWARDTRTGCSNKAAEERRDILSSISRQPVARGNMLLRAKAGSQPASIATQPDNPFQLYPPIV